MKKCEIEQHLKKVEADLLTLLPDEGSYVSVCKYKDLVHGGIWTEALQRAVDENNNVYLPASNEPYLLDNSIILHSGQHILADPNTVVRLTESTRVLMFRNEHTMDGTHQPISLQNGVKDRDISIIGGRYEESMASRAGYGKSGMYDEERSFYGVSTCMLFNNIDDLIIKDVTFAHTAGFGVQTGDLNRALFENIAFESCYADGLHLNGQSTDLIIRDIRGNVGDDLVALNMYDWQNSSVNWGPMERVLCEHLDLDKESRYKAMRIQPGTYYYDDDSSVDCGLYNAIIRDVKGINTFKMYYQTPRYRIGETPERGAVGTADDLYFEKIAIDLDRPIDKLREYMESDPLRGSFAGFEIGANIGHITFEDIDLTLHRDQYPYSYLICIGPKSVRVDDWEVFDPYLSSEAEHLYMDNIRVNGEKIKNITPYIKEICFVDINGDGHSTGLGKFREIHM